MNVMGGRFGVNRMRPSDPASHPELVRIPILPEDDSSQARVERFRKHSTIISDFPPALQFLKENELAQIVCMCLSCNETRGDAPLDRPSDPEN